MGCKKSHSVFHSMLHWAMSKSFHHHHYAHQYTQHPHAHHHAVSCALIPFNSFMGLVTLAQIWDQLPLLNHLILIQDSMVLALRPFRWADNPLEITNFILWSTCSWLSGPFRIIYGAGYPCSIYGTCQPCSIYGAGYPCSIYGADYPCPIYAMQYITAN